MQVRQVGAVCCAVSGRPGFELAGLQMKIGFTGTRKGMSDAQKIALRSILLCGGLTEFHHGDCIGADDQAHDIAVDYGLEPVIHPPENPACRAFRGALQIRPEASYNARNRRIVRDSDILIATPAEMVEQLRSGTWSTIRYARKSGRRVIIILPDGCLLT